MNTSKTLKNILYILTALMFYNTAYSDCNFNNASFNARLAPGSQGTNYNPFNNADFNARVAFTVQGVKGSCKYFISLSEDSSTGHDLTLTNADNTLKYKLFTSSNTINELKSYPVNSIDNVIVGKIADDFHYTDYAYFNIAAMQQAVATNAPYTQHLNFDLYSGEPDGKHQYVKNTNLLVSVNVPPVINFTLSQHGAYQDIGGENATVTFTLLPESQIQQNIYLVVKHNAGFNATFSSENNMQLKHKSEPMHNIGYKFKAGSQYLDFRHNNNAIFSHNQSFNTKTTIPLMLEIDSTDQSLIAGEYQDFITVLLEAL